MRGIPATPGNLNKTDNFERFIRQENPYIMTAMETGLHGIKKPNMPLHFNKQLTNNIIVKDDNPIKQTSHGAGTLIWTNEKFIIQPASQELNNEKT